jgi:cytochrome c oxidase subunit II
MTVAGTHESASAIAAQSDSVFIFILCIAAFFFVLTQGFLIYFAIRYRHKKGEERETPDIRSNLFLETFWIVIPTLLVFAIFVYGFVVYKKIVAPLPNAMEVGVVARQWMWEFKYPDGKTSINELRLPVGKPVKLTMTSPDVIHSLYLPDFRIKQDIVPGRYTTMYLQPDRIGRFQIFCAEYCGTGHSQMLAMLVVEKQGEYDEWIKGGGEAHKGEAPLEKGKELFARSGCNACHSTDGKPGVGPTLKGLFGRQVKLSDGRAVTADEDYIRESIVDPNAKVVAGFQPVMPTFKGSLKEDDISALITYIKTLK